MSTRTTVLAISGSLRTESINTKILEAIGNVASDIVDVTVADISDIPFYNADVQAEGIPESVETLRAAIGEADAVLISTPEYNYSIPGVLKNVLDWISKLPDRPFDQKPVAILGGSPGKLGTVRAQGHLRDVLLALNADVITKPEVYISGAHEAVTEDGFTQDDTTRFVRLLIEKLAERVQRIQTPSIAA